MSALLFQLPKASRSTAEMAIGSLCLQISSDRSFKNLGEGHGRRPLVSPLVKNWGIIIISQYAFTFLARLSSFIVQYSGALGVEEQHQSISNLVVKLYCDDDTAGEGTIGNKSNGDEVGPVAQRIRA
ncbi:hypothetical protein Goshw_024844, partial [Gossypium schwendimanii]|nr:hypothetical protein [Gossypium schwendimanii]